MSGGVDYLRGSESVPPPRIQSEISPAGMTCWRRGRGKGFRQLLPKFETDVCDADKNESGRICAVSVFCDLDTEIMEVSRAETQNSVFAKCFHKIGVPLF